MDSLFWRRCRRWREDQENLERLATYLAADYLLIPVLYVISLNDYNQTLLEDGTTNRMHESEKVFG